MKTNVSKRLEESRKELLDLGMRNPLLNHRDRSKQIKIKDELSEKNFSGLVTENHEMWFEAMKINPKKLGEVDPSDQDISLAFDELSENIIEEDRAKLFSLKTGLEEDKLHTRLLSIHNDARTYLEEQGVNILYIALGFLHWFESQTASEARRAPLVLIPVQLNRSSAKEGFRISYTGEEIGTNLSLQEKMRIDYQVDLKSKIEDQDILNLSNYFREVEDAIRGRTNWKVERNESVLGFFSFGKLLMYKDLDPNRWFHDQGPIGIENISNLLINGFKNSNQYGENIEIDKIMNPADIYQVVDADCSQTMAILDAKAGANLVIQGPPGTGKSQTITNIIAEFLGRGKKILFVSEKMAALEVVKRRLDIVGLGKTVLELHSHKMKKRSVLSELNSTLKSESFKVVNSNDDLRLFENYRDKLNAYCEAINSPIGQTKVNFVKALGHILGFPNNYFSENAFEFSAMKKWSDSDYQIARILIEKLDHYLTNAGPPRKNPFFLSRLKELAPSKRLELKKILTQAAKLNAELFLASANLADRMNLETPTKRHEIEIIIRAARRAMEAPHLKGVNITSGQWQLRRDEIALLIRVGRRVNRVHRNFNSWLIEEAWSQDLRGIRQNYINYGNKWWRFLSGRFRKSKAYLQGLCRKPLPKNIEKVLEILDAVLEIQKLMKTLDNLSALGQSLFGAQWRHDKSDWDVLEQISAWIIKLYRDVGNGLIPKGILDFLSGSPKIDKIRSEVNKVEILLNKHSQAMATINRNLDLRLSEKHRIDWNVSIKKQGKILIVWLNNLDKLYDLVKFNQIKSEMESGNLGFVLSKVENWERSGGELTMLFDFSWYKGLLEKAYVEFPPIQSFDRFQHEKYINEFSRLDKEMHQYNQTLLKLIHVKGLPKQNQEKELQLIKYEINKKRRHIPIRRLIEQAGKTIQKIKPVFMMSPMSIAKFMPPNSIDFDLVIFDEASQVKPVDAFGAILRGKQVIVIGDSKQLPPTNFFENIIDDADDDDNNQRPGNLESILSLFSSKGAPERMLKWHYRSRNHSLISVSNHEFYDNKLLVFPCSGLNVRARGLKLHHLENTYYDRGKSRTNLKEAEIVAQNVMLHIKKNPDLTLGVVAFSVAQRDAIEAQIDLLRRKDPTSEWFFRENENKEPFFIKNLENVQGDERDIIFISIGYGKTIEGNFSMTFGPLNRIGGERRLNVLISRARYAMDVFSNFRANDMDTTRSNALGVVALKNFLLYAETKKLDYSKTTSREPDSPFELAVIDALRNNGIDVEPQVGSAGYFIDIGVKDPTSPGRYILGIECDGASYHSARSARDRDRLRQEVLENLGWKLYRIWSTDWYRNTKSELERVLLEIEKATEDSSNSKSSDL